LRKTPVDDAEIAPGAREAVPIGEPRLFEDGSHSIGVDEDEAVGAKVADERRGELRKIRHGDTGRSEPASLHR
jgi:hypothetical protein